MLSRRFMAAGSRAGYEYAISHFGGPFPWGASVSNPAPSALRSHIAGWYLFKVVLLGQNLLSNQ
jgi:hypothetical protein